MKKTYKLFFLLILITSFSNKLYSQNIVEEYEQKKNDSIRIGAGAKDFLPFIQKGYTLMLPKEKEIKGVLIFLEDSGYDNKNKISKQIYNNASKNGFAVLSVSSEIPFDFYFSKNSAISSHEIINKVFEKYNLPNKNIFFIGVALSGHRAMKHIEFMKEDNYAFQLNIKGIVLCNTKLDWAMEWYKYDREKRNKRNDLWEPTFANYILETNLNGTPKTNAESYYHFSTYSYFDEKKENIKYYTNYSTYAGGRYSALEWRGARWGRADGRSFAHTCSARVCPCDGSYRRSGGWDRKGRIVKEDTDSSMGCSTNAVEST